MIEIIIEIIFEIILEIIKHNVEWCFALWR
jgi:hypothetical protein